MTTLFSIQLLNPKAKYYDFLSLPLVIGIGKFTLLLPSLDVVAVSQAPSPEQNPNSLLPVNASIVQYTTD